ncbi:unnamed protein product, partial [Allacma fusca]
TLTSAWHHPTSDFYPSRRLYYKNPRNAPSEFCPRDEAQAQLQGRTCLRKCTSDEDCKSKRKRCLCDGACGLSCIKPGAVSNTNIETSVSKSHPAPTWLHTFRTQEIILEKKTPKFSVLLWTSLR